MSVPAVFIRKSTKEILINNLYPRADMLPVVVSDPDYEWFIKHVPYPEPVYDPRVFIMETNLPDLNDLDSFQEHPSYPGVREYRITYNPKKRPNDEIIREIENAEKEANATVWSEAIHKDEALMMMNSVYKDAKSFELTEEEQASLERMNLLTVRIAKNKDTKEIKIGLVQSGQDPNIDEGWERN